MPPADAPSPQSWPTLTPRDTACLLLAVGLALAAFLNAVPNGFIINWDDDLYVTQNEAIRDFSWGGIGRLFTTLHFENYHPLTNLSHMIEYRLFGLAPLPYHLVNVLLHAGNVAWVYLLIHALCRRAEAALAVAVIFGVHPMHVESVAWIAERKDVLYAFFFLAALYAYVSHVRRGKGLAAAWLLFLCACLSKSAAVTLPLLMLLVDVYLRRPLSRALLIEKVPFLLLSGVFGAVALLSQSATGATALVPHYPWLDRIVLASYAVCHHLARFFFPADLSILHMYPAKTGAFFPPAYYLAPLPLAGLAVLVHRAGTIRKDLAFGLLFFLATLILVVQIIPVGRAIVAERYTYVPYIGLGFTLSILYVRLKDGLLPAPRRWATALFWLFAAWSACLFVASVSRNRVWKDGETLFSDAIRKDPGNPLLHYNRGYVREVNEDYRAALGDFDAAIRLKPCYAQAYSNRAGTRFFMQDPRGALEDYTKAIECDPAGTDGYYNRGYVRESLGDRAGAMEDYTQAIQHRRESAHVSYTARGNLKQAMDDSSGAIADYGEAIRLKPGYRPAYFNRGNARLSLGDPQGAVNDYQEAARLDPSRPEPFYTMGISKIGMGMKDEACLDFQTARGMGYRPAEDMLRAHCPGAP